MSKKRIAAILADCLLILLTLIFIFGNSFQNVEKSTEISEGVTDIVEKLPPIQSAIDKGVIEKGSLEGILRSLAHAAEFATLGAEIMLLFLLLLVKPFYLTATLPFLICLALGITDEAIQGLSDRAPELVDVLKDFGGALAGGLFVLGIYGIIRLIKKKKTVSTSEAVHID